MIGWRFEPTYTYTGVDSPKPNHLTTLQSYFFVTQLLQVNIIFDRVGRVDPITKGMEIAVHWFGLDIDVMFWSQHISYILVRPFLGFIFEPWALGFVALDIKIPWRLVLCNLGPRSMVISHLSNFNGRRTYKVILGRFHLIFVWIYLCTITPTFLSITK